MVLSVGELTRRTPTVDNNLNPDWQAGQYDLENLVPGGCTMVFEAYAPRKAMRKAPKSLEKL